jgi:2-deoxy-D-gluconate 3-dehydrogenase
MEIVKRFDLTGKTALVTGASRGIGRAIALGLGEAGADVAVLARSTQDLESLAKELESLGRRTIVLTCDVTNREEIEQSVDAAISELGSLDIAVNNAGGVSNFGPFAELSVDDWQYAFDLNLKPAINFCRVIGRHMLEQETGSIINVAASIAVAGAPMLSHYAATKAAVMSLSQTLGGEWAGAGVRVNALALGWIETALTKAVIGDQTLNNEVIHGVPDRIWRSPEDAVGPTLFLASDASRFVNGTTLWADGGLSSYGANGPALVDLMPVGRVTT